MVEGFRVGIFFKYDLFVLTTVSIERWSWRIWVNWDLIWEDYIFDASVFIFLPKFLLIFILTAFLWLMFLASFSTTVEYLLAIKGLKIVYLMPIPWTITLYILMNYSSLIKFWLKLNFLIALKICSFWLIYNLNPISLKICIILW